MIERMTFYDMYNSPIQGERIDTHYDPKNCDSEKYAYLYCRCPYQFSIVWRVEKVRGYIKGVCPECKEQIGIFIP